MKDTQDMAQANETETIRPTWAQIQNAISTASWQRTKAEVAWNRYEEAKAALTASDAYAAMTAAQAEWNKCLTNAHEAEDKRDAILKLALGIEEDEAK